MEFVKCFAPAMIDLLKVCLLLLFLGYPSSASGQFTGCPFVEPLSSYTPSIGSVGLPPLTTSHVSAKLDRIVSSLIENGSIPFYAVSVVHEDQMVFTSGLATSNFMIGSITKTFTALGALMLREKGLLSLDDPVKKFLPTFKVINPYGPHDITIRELMGHVSGLPQEICAFPTPTTCAVEEADALKALAQIQLVRPPWSSEPTYSNLGFGLLGHTWEKATSPSKSWGEFIEEDILKPLEMNSSGVHPTDVTLVVNSSVAELEVLWSAPSGLMYSTAIDLAKYLIFLLKAQPALVSATTIREWTNSRTIFADGSGGYALPWELVAINATGRDFLITKDGDIGEFESFIAIHPPTQLGVTVLFVVNNASTISSQEVSNEVLNYLIPLVETETAGVIDSLYTGHYVCKAAPPTFMSIWNESIGVFGGFIDISYSPSLGFFASLNVSLLIAGIPTPQSGTLGMLLKNSTENSFWLGPSPGADCTDFSGYIGVNPSATDPHAPGTIYMYEIEFDFAKKTLAWPSVGAVCSKKTVMLAIFYWYVLYPIFVQFYCTSCARK